MANQIETNIEISHENRNKATVLFRIFLSIPVVIFLWLFTEAAEEASTLNLLVFTLPVAAALVVRHVYPSWLLSFNHAILEFETRFVAYLLLLTDDYPSFERNPKVSVILPDVEGGKRLDRWLPLFKWLLAIPLYIVGAIYVVLTIFTTFFAWIITAVSGRYPDWAGNIALGTIKYWNRVFGYAFVLVTDEYPSFKLD
ncbi:MAG: DUF4389 domain-containing protein [Actinobacteria bacterium]|nr:DUF4389 domain-containing protein [Actinomycetota bacterium]